ncbi:MAG: hypothetical protein WC261_14195 [Synergistaceae bacterium]
MPERKVINMASDLWNSYVELNGKTECESREIAAAIHVIQGHMAVRLHAVEVKDSPFTRPGTNLTGATNTIKYKGVDMPRLEEGKP